MKIAKFPVPLRVCQYLDGRFLSQFVAEFFKKQSRNKAKRFCPAFKTYKSRDITQVSSGRSLLLEVFRFGRFILNENCHGKFPTIRPDEIEVFNKSPEVQIRVKSFE